MSPVRTTRRSGFDMQRGHFWRGDNNDSTGGIWYTTHGRRRRALVTIQAPVYGLAEQPELQPRHLRAGSVDAEPADAERRHPAGLAERIDRAVHRGPHKWAPNRNIAFGGGQERAELEGHRPARVSGLRSVRQRQDRHQGERQPRRRAGLDPLRAGQQPGVDHQTQTARTWTDSEPATSFPTATSIDGSETSERRDAARG